MRTVKETMVDKMAVAMVAAVEAATADHQVEGVPVDHQTNN